MAARVRQAQQESVQTQPAKGDDAFIHAMARIPLQPGQMLLLGPRSVAILSTPGTGKTRLPDMWIIDKSEWGMVKKASHRRR